MLTRQPLEAPNTHVRYMCTDGVVGGQGGAKWKAQEGSYGVPRVWLLGYFGPFPLGNTLFSGKLHGFGENAGLMVGIGWGEDLRNKNGHF